MPATIEELPDMNVCVHVGMPRPPTGPLTAAETADAEELPQKTLAKDNERIEREQKEASDRRNHEV